VSAPDELDEEGSAVARQIAELVEQRGLTVAVAESLTGGKIACHLAAAPSSSTWFRGGIVAYSSEVKYDVLGVPRGPVVSESAAAAMARGVARVLGATLSVAVTGVGGPEPQEGQPPGTVWLAVAAGDGVRTELRHFRGDPPEVLDQTVLHALQLLRAALPR